MINSNNKRNRVIYGIIILVVIFLGLSSRKFYSIMPKVIGEYAGDTLWGLMIFLMIGFCFRTYSIRKVAVMAIIFSHCIEISQLYHVPWIDSIRHTAIGGLILGFGFLWSDLLCYTAGIVIGIGIDKVMKKLIK